MIGEHAKGSNILQGSKRLRPYDRPLCQVYCLTSNLAGTA